jgi:hypothetical protein
MSTNVVRSCDRCKKDLSRISQLNLFMFEVCSPCHAETTSFMKNNYSVPWRRIYIAFICLGICIGIVLGASFK